MKRFVWRLERVLKIKTIEEQKKRAELFALTERLSQCRGELLTQEMILKEIIIAHDTDRSFMDYN